MEGSAILKKESNIKQVQFMFLINRSQM